ncbi:MAG: hypothetical protein HY072_05360 [Deltaproteobacteria bacterium]|nr:hypothetical protein [Deltaproteobacteria bacterium]
MLKLLLALFIFTSPTYAEDTTAAAQTITPARPEHHNGDEGRNFYEVLEDLLADFEYDLKNGQVSGLKDLSIRNIVISENVPASFKSHLELSITERILKTTKTRIIQCLACKAKRTTLKGDQVVITSPETNPTELARIAKLSNISNFMDIAFLYNPSGMILSMTIIDPETGGFIWSRSYNSETSRASVFRRGTDYSQIDDARKMTEYQPMVQYRLTIYYLYERDIAGYAGTLSLAYRMMERYDNRRKEVGFEAGYIRTISSLTGPSTSQSSLFSGLNLTLLFMHSWNLIGSEENFNLVRGNVLVGIGGTYASGFLGGLVRGGYEWRLAKHWATSVILGYRPKATYFIGSSSSSVSGVEFGIGISGLF